jgi:type VI secretion system protein ImpK
MFAGWSGRPLQEELFGEHMGGELFFRYLQPTLTRQDSEETADLLEVFQLCLLLGFRGRYGSASAELGQLMGQIGDKVARIRGGGGELSPAWHPTVDAIRSRPDRWVRRLTVGAIACVLVVVLTFAFSSISLRSGQSELTALSAPPAR